MGADFLFAMPSLVSGLARTLDLGATFDAYNISRDGVTADRRALASDWQAVGDALAEAMELHARAQVTTSQAPAGFEAKTA
jgi:hypothetical protein